MTITDDALKSLNQNLRDIFDEYRSNCINCLKQFEKEVEEERKKLEKKQRAYNDLLTEYDHLNEMAQKGVYLGHIDDMCRANIASDIGPTSNPQETIDHLRTDIERLSSRFPKIDEIIAGINQNYKITLSTRIFTGLRMIRMYLDENHIDVEDSIEKYKKDHIPKINSKLEELRKQCADDMAIAIKKENERIGREIIKAANNAKS